jgi:hypothetical protein
MHALEQVFAEILAGGLQRKSIKSCSRWASMYRVAGGQTNPGLWNYNLHPWSREMHDSEATFNVGMKSAQMAYTETLLNRTFFKMDIEGVNCLYVFPNKTPDASDFSASRFDPSLELSPHLRSLFSDVKNVGHKRAGPANLWIRGSKSRPQLKSIDPAFICLDEVDEMHQENIQLALRRTDGQLVSQVWAISTPTIPEYGIHKMILQTSQESWFFQCPCCWKEITLTFPECLVVTADDLLDPKLKDSYVKCPLCDKKIEHEDKVKSQNETGRWIPQVDDFDPERRGFYINQLSSCVKTPDKIAITAVEAETNPAAEQELWNSIAGLPHVVAGAQIEDHHIDACRTTERRMTDPVPGYKLRTMGVDVGKWLHYEIDGWAIPKMGPDINMIAKAEVLQVGRVKRFDELATLFREFNVNFMVIDKQPEERMVYELCCQFWGRIKRCHYARGMGAKKMTVATADDEHLVSVSRTFWLDTSLGRIRSGRMRFPRDLPEEYCKHVKNLIKKYEEDSGGDDVSKYIKRGDDHYAHARNYCEMALPLAASMVTNQNIRSFL